MASRNILQDLKERDVKAGRGYINDIGEYVPYEKEKKESGWDEESIYRPKGGTAAKAQARIDKQKSPKFKAMMQDLARDAESKIGGGAKDVIARERLGRGRGMPDEMERRQKAMRSEYFPQTGTRADEEKGFFSGMYDKTVGEYQRGQEKKERLKEETKAAMAAEPDPFVKKEIARKGHAQYMKIAATEGRSERDRETAGGAALDAQRERDDQKYGRMEQHAGYRDRRIMDEEAGREGDTALEREATRLRKQRRIEGEEGPQVASGAGDEIQETGFIQKSLRDLPVVGGLFGENERDMSGDGQVAEEATSKFGARSEKAPWEVQKEEERQKRLEAQSKIGPAGGTRPGEGGLREPIRDTSEAGREEAESQFARSQQPTIEDDPRLSGKGPEFEREYEADEFAQDQARDAISTLKPDEGDEVIKQIEDVKGKGSPEWLEAKEALRDENGERRFVRYAGSGLVIDMKRLGEDIDKNYFFKYELPNTPVANRTALMASRGYFPEGDLSIAQKQSAKEIKEIEILNLRASKLKMEAEKLESSVPADKKMQYDQIMTGFRQATKDKDWDSASMYASELRGIGLPLKDFDPVALEAASNQRLVGKEPHMLNIAKRHGIMVGGKPSLTPFYNQQKELTHKLTFLGKDAKAAGAGLAASLEVKAGPHTGTTVTFGEILKREGIETWDKVYARIQKGGDDQVSKNLAQAMGVEKLKDVSKEAYLHYAKQLAHDKISRTVWGSAYDEIKQGGKEGRAAKEKAAQDNFDPSKEESSFGHEDYKPTDWVKEQGTPESREAAKIKRAAEKAEKVKSGKAKAFRKEKEDDNRMVQDKRGQRKMTMKEKEAEYVKEGKERLDELVAGRVNPKSKIKKAVAGHPRFNSTEEAIKFYKNDPKGKKLLKDMSLAFRHFISQK